MSSSLSAQVSKTSSNTSSKTLKFAKQAQRLSLGRDNKDKDQEHAAIAARFVTPRDAVVETLDGNRLPAVPIEEAQKLNRLRDEAISDDKQIPSLPEQSSIPYENEVRDEKNTIAESTRVEEGAQSPETHGALDVAKPPAHTHPLFPPLPLYGPPSVLRSLQCQTFRAVSFCLSLSFLGVIVMGSCINGIGVGVKSLWLRVRGQNPNLDRPFLREEIERESMRREAAEKWKRRQRRTMKRETMSHQENSQAVEDSEAGLEYPPLEGGHDPVICDIGYYARRVGLDVEIFKVQTEDGFILTLWHIYNPQEYKPLSESERAFRKPNVFYDEKSNGFSSSNRRYPVLLIHGLLQSSGAYCANDDDSLAFFLCKAGYDVWLGNNRCGFEPQHATLKYSDPRMWCWNIRHMGVLDLPAFVSRVLYETGFKTLGLICHSQGTTEAMVALAEDQRPELGEHISVFCGLAPAAYAGPLIKKAYFRFMRKISPNAFRLFFGIHAFIPFMMTMHSLLPSRLYGALGYRIFSYLFNWSDRRWDRRLRDRMFQFSPVYVSAESMRWWLGRDGFAVQKCILATKEQGLREEEQDRAYESSNVLTAVNTDDADYHSPEHPSQNQDRVHDIDHHHHRKQNAWYGPKTPPFALWIAGSDDLVDGRRLLRRIRNGREPHVNLVHHKIIDEYEHLDVIWAIDAIEQVGKEVAEVVWRTVSEDTKRLCRVPRF